MGESSTEVIEKPVVEEASEKRDAENPTTANQEQAEQPHTPRSLLEKLIDQDHRAQEIDEALDRIRETVEAGKGMSDVSEADKITLLAVLEAGGGVLRKDSGKNATDYEGVTKKPLQGGTMNQD